jgi:phenol/toluene 2-monooxygenase (NADH) P0/A0
MNAVHAADPLDVSDPPDPVDALPRADVSRKFVRVVERHPNGVVAFEFSVGWPDLGAELALPQPLFEQFCARHAVERLPDALRGAAGGGAHGAAPVDDTFPGATP